MKNLFNGLISGVKQKGSVIADKAIQGAAEHASVPSYVAAALKKQLTGKPLNRSLAQGMGLGSAAGGMSLANDSSDNTPGVNIGRAATLAALGLASPATLRSGAAVKNILSSYRNVHRGLGGMGIEMEPTAKLMSRFRYMESANNKGLKKFVNDLVNSQRHRSLLKGFLTPSRELEVGKLTNSGVDLNSAFLAQAPALFNKTTFNAGHVINPNIGRMIQNGSAAAKLKSLGFTKFTGNTAPTKRLGNELGGIVDNLYRQLVNKGIQANKQTALPTATTAKFPGGLDKAHTKTIAVKTPHGAVDLDAPPGGNSLNYYSMQALPKRLETYDPKLRQWLHEQNITSDIDLESLNSNMRSFIRHAQQTARDNPARFAAPDFKLPNVRTIFDNPVEGRYDFAQKL